MVTNNALDDETARTVYTTAGLLRMQWYSSTSAGSGLRASRSRACAGWHCAWLTRGILGERGTDDEGSGPTPNTHHPNGCA
jgi:hypothetical protein